MAKRFIFTPETVLCSFIKKNDSQKTMFNSPLQSYSLI